LFCFYLLSRGYSFHFLTVNNTQEGQSEQGASNTGSTENGDNEITEKAPMGVSDNIATDIDFFR